MSFDLAKWPHGSTLSAQVMEATAPLWRRLPLVQAMPRLVEPGPAAGRRSAAQQAALVEMVNTIRHGFPGKMVEAALWLYVDELDRSHALVQSSHGCGGATWHGVMHRREGDFANSHYWFNVAGPHPALADLPGYDSHALIDQVAQATRAGDAGIDPSALLELQRREWAALFAWSVIHDVSVK